ncbi:MAG: DDE transposase family protein [Chitinophagales bacterium]|nr:DDE transposase family protein [Chitinophagales bacterium]
MKVLSIEQKKQWAKILYTKEGVSVVKELATRVGVTEKTMGKWVADGNWKTLKKSLLLTRQEQLAALYNELEQVNNHIQTKPEGKRFADAKEADARRKLIKDIESLEQETSLNDVYNVARKMLEHWRTIDIEKTKLLTECFDHLISTILQ